MLLYSPSDLLVDQIRDLYSVESQVEQHLPHLAQAAPHVALADLLQHQQHVHHAKKARLERAISLLGESAEGAVSKAMAGLIEGGSAHIANAKEPETQNLIIVAHTLRIYYYELAGYKIAVALARHIHGVLVGNLLEESLQETKTATKKLGECAAIFLGGEHCCGGACGSG
jgi:ferritin-like metal-binding protein YciE